jgi:hypothetical protein
MLPPDMATYLWAALSVIVYLCAVAMIWRVIRPSLKETQWIGLVGTTLLFGSFLENVIVGQTNCLILLGLAAFVWGLVDSRYEWVGDLGIALAIAIKMTPVILLLIPLLRGDWRRLLRVAAGLVLLAALSLVLFGFGPWADFFEVLPYLFQGAPGVYNQTIRPALAWLFGRLGWPNEVLPVRIGQAFSVATLGAWVAIAAMWSRRKPLLASACLGIVTMTISSSLLWHHHLVYLVIPLFYLLLNPGPYRNRGVTTLGWIALGLIQIDRLMEVALQIPAFFSIAGYLLLYAASLVALLGAPASTEEGISGTQEEGEANH